MVLLLQAENFNDEIRNAVLTTDDLPSASTTLIKPPAADSEQLAIEALHLENIKLYKQRSIEEALELVERESSKLDNDTEIFATDIIIVNKSDEDLMRDVELEPLPIESRQPEKEACALKHLKEKLQDVFDNITEEDKFPEVYGDIRLLRFLRGHHYDVDIASQKYREMLTWRRDTKIDDIRRDIVNRGIKSSAEFPNASLISTYYASLNLYDAHDRDGNILVIESTGKADCVGIMDHVSEEDWNRYFYYEMELRSIILDKKSRDDRNLVRTTLIRDLDGVSVSKIPSAAMLSRVKFLLRVASLYYPETSSGMYLVNTPWVFYTLWKAVKLWFNQYQLRKIHILNADYQEKLHELINKNQLPCCVGGTNSKAVMPVVENSVSRFTQLVADGASVAEISAGKTLTLPFSMQINDTITWTFEVESLDLDFEVKIRTQGDGGAVEDSLVPKSKFQFGKAHEGCCTTASTSGTVVLCWDNTASWTRKKRIAYKTEVIKASSKIEE